MKNKLKSLVKAVISIAVIILVALLSLLFYRGCEARNMPDLQEWHTFTDWEDNLTERQHNSFSDYLLAEQKFLDSIYTVISPTETETYNRYVSGSRSYPYLNGKNMNASFHTFPPDTIPMNGGILLLHGLSDSPYHMRALARVFADRGYYAIGLRLPGHGTIPGELNDVQWEDWAKATRFGVEMLQREIEKGTGKQFFVGGFSTGGALALNYALQALRTDEYRAPEKIFLFSPAIGVSGFAEVSDWHKLISWISYFRKFKWLHIKPEYDPCKYNSFPKNAADQVHELTKANQSLIEDLIGDPDTVGKFPPIYAFQSLVDATVSTQKLNEFFAAIGTNNSELVMFDFNHAYDVFIKSKIRNQQPTAALTAQGFDSKLTIVTNPRKKEEQEVENQVNFYRAYTQMGSDNIILEKIPTDTVHTWPEFAFALSHVSIPIAPDDPFYGETSLLGSISVKGEKGVLLIEASELDRIRYNPFFFFIEDRIRRAISEESL